MRSSSHRFSNHHESRRHVFWLDMPLGLVRRPRKAPRLPPPCQSAVAWKYSPCRPVSVPKSISTVPRNRFQLANRSFCSLLMFQRESLMYWKSKRTPSSSRRVRSPPHSPKRCPCGPWPVSWLSGPLSVSSCRVLEWTGDANTYSPHHDRKRKWIFRPYPRNPFRALWVWKRRSGDGSSPSELGLERLVARADV